MSPSRSNTIVRPSDDTSRHPRALVGRELERARGNERQVAVGRRAAGSGIGRVLGERRPGNTEHGADAQDEADEGNTVQHHRWLRRRSVADLAPLTGRRKYGCRTLDSANLPGGSLAAELMEDEPGHGTARVTHKVDLRVRFVGEEARRALRREAHGPATGIR